MRSRGDLDRETLPVAVKQSAGTPGSNIGVNIDLPTIGITIGKERHYSVQPCSVSAWIMTTNMLSY